MLLVSCLLLSPGCESSYKLMLSVWGEPLLDDIMPSSSKLSLSKAWLRILSLKFSSRIASVSCLWVSYVFGVSGGSYYIIKDGLFN